MIYVAGTILEVQKFVIRNLSVEGRAGEMRRPFYCNVVFLSLPHFMSPTCCLEQTQVSASKHMNQPIGS